MRPPKACLFDLDGLLLDTESLHGKAWSITAKKFGKKLTKDQLLVLRGRRRVDCALQITKWLDKTINHKEILFIHKPISKSLLSQSKAMPGAISLVEKCFALQVPMALVTSSNEESLQIKTTPHPWLKLIQTRVLGDDPSLKDGKPSPEPYLLAANKLKVNPNECWAMEDSQAGTDSALKAGCKVWVLCSKQIKNSDGDNSSLCNPTYVTHLNEILEKLEIIWKD
ncbi:HAD family phosphatase [Prochlorococcus sp. MIT 1341]|uniref:HAD family hydrolase n=1 Tax=Prochlorococcus sp. MIT 1341 TaxID=3096221 RepID=UPI002A750F71|nr:HAD family phosphatase [Prochlorococcus sp. MIT 1341]